jgi:DNA replication and repair protein RecF
VVLCGPNGSGKTNLLEALSLLASGQGLRGAPYQELAKVGEAGWAVAAHLRTAHGAVDIGTGGSASSETSRRSGRIVRIDGEGSGGLRRTRRLSSRWSG